jgi:hypothetical protein
MQSDWVRLPQVEGIAASECVALCPLPPGVVVTCFVIGSRDLFVNMSSADGPNPHFLIENLFLVFITAALMA